MYKPEISKNHAALHDLIERWNTACDETYIMSGRDKFWMTHRAAEALAQWYETQFRENRTFKYEERMRYWRMVAAKELDKTEGQSSDGVFYTHPAWLARRDEYTMYLRRSPNLEAVDGRRAMYGVREAAEREDDKLTALSVIFDGFTRTHQAAHEEHELHLQAVRETRLLPPPVIKALREASATPMAVWADITSAGSTRDAELWEEGKTTPSPQSCERMWAHWHTWVRTNAPLLGIPEADIETAIAKPPLLLPADTPARTLTQYALMLHGQRFTLHPGT